VFQISVGSTKLPVRMRVAFLVITLCAWSLRRIHAVCPEGDQEGLQIPLSVHGFVDDPLNPKASGGSPPAMTIEVSPITSAGEVLPAQRVLFDTGSAGLALCDTSFSSQLEDVYVPGLVPCKVYGGPGNWVFGYWGKVYKGGLDIGGVRVEDANYGVMQQETGMPCNIKGFMGIFGAAFKPNFKMWETTAALPDQLWTPGQVDDCKTSIPGADGQTTLTPPLEQLTTELAAGGVSRVGIYWSGRVGPSGGMLYLNSAATANPHYVTDCALRARLKQGAAGHYNIFVKSMSVGGVKFTGFPCTEDMQTFCIMDTGAGTTTLPDEVVDAIGDSDGPLEIELEGPSPEQPAVTLRFDIAAMKGVLDPPIDKGGPIKESITMLGLPTWAFYYTVFSSDGTVDFVPHECQDACGEESMPESVSDARAAALGSGHFADLQIKSSADGARLRVGGGLQQRGVEVAASMVMLTAFGAAVLGVARWRRGSTAAPASETAVLCSAGLEEVDDGMFSG